MDIEGVLAIGAIFIGLPWIVLHYITRWKTGAALNRGDEALLDELYQLARRLEDRMATVERLVAAEQADSPTASASAGRQTDPRAGDSHLRAVSQRANP